MNNIERSWYIQYDFKTFHILEDPNYNDLIFKCAELFLEVEGPLPDP